MDTYNSFSELPGAGESVIGKGQSFQNLAAGQQGLSGNTAFNVAVTNMTSVTPEIVVSDKPLQDKLDRHFIGSQQREYEAPHITIRSPDGDKPIARVRIRDGSLMEPSEVDGDVIKAVQADMLKRPNDYIENWNENNPDHAIPLIEESNEQPKKDESWKEAAWYKEQERFLPLEEEDTGEEPSA